MEVEYYKLIEDHSINFNITGYSFERNRDVIEPMVRYLDDNWALSIWSAVAYVIVIFGGQRLMNSYGRFDLTYTLATWNALLAIFSILGTVRMVPNVYYSLTRQTFYESVCTIDWTYMSVTRLWISLFSISKIIELGDTAFIVLRKQPLILLHWYHHITVLIYTWYSYADRTSSGRWYITMNYAVHSVMYTYYALRALRFRAPQWIRMSITLFQLSQMVVGVYIAMYVYKLKQAATPCGITDNNMRLSFAMYFSYFLLFAKFFYDAYIRPKPSASRTSAKETVANGYPERIVNSYPSNGKVAANGHASNGHLTRSELKKHL